MLDINAFYPDLGPVEAFEFQTQLDESQQLYDYVSRQIGLTGFQQALQHNLQQQSEAAAEALYLHQNPRARKLFAESDRIRATATSSVLQGGGPSILSLL